MKQNPYPVDSTGGQPTEMIPPTMEDLQPKPVAPAPTPARVADDTSEMESIEARQEEARTVKYAIGKLNEFLLWFIGVLEVTLAIRFVFKLIGALHTNLFTGFLYTLTDIILFPFQSIVNSPSVRTDQAFEWSTLIAMAIYWLMFWAIRRFLRILISSPEETAS